MGMASQILLGTAAMALTCCLHVVIVAACAVYLSHFRVVRTTTQRMIRLNLTVLTTGLGAIVVAHTLGVWIWAALFRFLGVLPVFEEAFYFATVTYTTLGYGDIVLGPDHRILGTFASVAGLLNFGISTAFLLGILVRILPIDTRHR